MFEGVQGTPERRHGLVGAVLDHGAVGPGGEDVEVAVGFERLAAARSRQISEELVATARVLANIGFEKIREKRCEGTGCGAQPAPVVAEYRRGRQRDEPVVSWETRY